MRRGKEWVKGGTGGGKEEVTEGVAGSLVSVKQASREGDRRTERQTSSQAQERQAPVKQKKKCVEELR